MRLVADQAQDVYARSLSGEAPKECQESAEVAVNHQPKTCKASADALHSPSRAAGTRTRDRGIMSTLRLSAVRPRM